MWSMMVDYRSIPRSEDLFQVSLEKALELLAQEKKGRGKRMLTPLKELGTYNKHPVNIYSGKYGPYIKWDKQNYSIPKETSFENISLDDAIKFIKEKKGTKKGSVKPFSKKGHKEKNQEKEGLKHRKMGMRAGFCMAFNFFCRESYRNFKKYDRL